MNMKKTIIPSITTMDDLHYFIEYTPCEWACLKMGDINNLAYIVSTLHKNKRKALLHLDSVKGIAKDKEGIRYLKQIGVDAVISMKLQHLKLLREAGILSILGSFIIDSSAITQTISNIKSGKPDAVLIMPMTVPPFVYAELEKYSSCIIAGGLGQEHSQINQAFSNGASACIVTNRNRLTETYTI